MSDLSYPPPGEHPIPPRPDPAREVVALGAHLRDRMLAIAGEDLAQLGPRAAQIGTEILAESGRLGALALAGADVSRELAHVRAQALNLEAAVAAVVGRAINEVLAEGARKLSEMVGAMAAGAIAGALGPAGGAALGAVRAAGA